MGKGIANSMISTWMVQEAMNVLQADVFG
jgi:hypothetical protein